MMKKPATLLCAVLVGTLLFDLSFASNEKSQTDRLCDKTFRIVSPDGEKALGSYRIKAEAKDSGKIIEIGEFISLDYRGKKAEMKSTVVYRNNTSLSPEEGTAETKINGKTCMKGSVEFSEMTVNLECKGFLNKRTGKSINPPLEFKKKGQPIPEGILVFQSALPTIGPRILPKAGELENVVFVEFPDDLGAPELIKFKQGYRLVREVPDEKGEYSIAIYAPHSNKSISRVRFDKNDQLVSMVSLGKLRFVEAEEKKQ